MELISQQYQLLTGDARLPKKALKVSMALRLTTVARSRPEAAWMTTVTAMIKEVGLEATRLWSAAIHSSLHAAQA